MNRVILLPSSSDFKKLTKHENDADHSTNRACLKLCDEPRNSLGQLGAVLNVFTAGLLLINEVAPFSLQGDKLAVEILRLCADASIADFHRLILQRTFANAKGLFSLGQGRCCKKRWLGKSEQVI